MDKLAAQTFLRTHGWLSRTPVAFQDRLLARCDLLNLAQGQPIYQVGDRAGGLFAVVEGHVELHYAVTGDDPTLAYVCGPGIWAGDTAAIVNEQRRVSLVAGSQCRLLRLLRAEMVRITEHDPATWQYFAQLVAHNYFNTLNVIDALRRSDPVERIAMTLCNLLLDQPTGQVVVNASQSDLGSMAQLGRSTVNAALSELEERGLIRRGYAVGDVLDADALRGFAQGAPPSGVPIRRHG